MALLDADGVQLTNFPIWAGSLGQNSSVPVRRSRPLRLIEAQKGPDTFSDRSLKLWKYFL